MSDIMSISRLRMGTDGEGVTTLVGFYGCPLDCKYCINKHCHDDGTMRGDYTADELVEILSIDEAYYRMTGGGVTFGGGEPLMQAEFIHEVCQKMSRHWHRTIETSLYAPWEQIQTVLDDIDYWYVDIKDINEKIYKKYTGHSNKMVINNLAMLVNAIGPEKICVRLPLIPIYNTEKDRDGSFLYIWENINSELNIELFDYIRC